MKRLALSALLGVLGTAQAEQAPSLGPTEAYWQVNRPSDIKHADCLK
jgi:hypothetical protein